MAPAEAFSNEKFKVGLCQTTVDYDKTKSLANAKAAVAKAVEQGAQLVVLGEMFACPYATKYFRDYGEKIPAVGEAGTDPASPVVHALSSWAKAHGIWLVGGALPELDGDKVYNTCLVFNSDGCIVARHRKAHLFDINVEATATRAAIKFKESDVLSAGNDITMVDLPWCRAGVGICYDARFPEYALAMRQRGAKLLIYPGAFNTVTGAAHWSVIARGRAVDAQCYVVFASPARSTDPKDYQAWGHSLLVNPWAEVLVEAEHEPTVMVTEVDPSEADRIRNQVPTTFQKRSNMYVPYAEITEAGTELMGPELKKRKL